ncbi:MAG: prepilin-type N-terminal cleavage/methylation domain-containing protein [Luminiphilus sp.]|nr:prepilin-type N-terminal cleavage/methylation domain-containing protein [Luminiphilus sp.]
MRSTGFSLVELLIALALGTWLISAAGLTAQRLWLMARLSADEVELVERGDFALRHLSDALLRASPIIDETLGLSPCDEPDLNSWSGTEVKAGTGIRVVGQGQFRCLPSRNLVENSPLLIVEEAWSCHGQVYEGVLRTFDWLEDYPGTSARDKLQTPFAFDHLGVATWDCAPAASVTAWSRRVYYLRDFSWDEGDGVGALMMKLWRLDGRGFGRGEVLVPGVINWTLEPIKLPIKPSSRGAAHLVSGVDVGLTLWGWRAGLSSRVMDIEVKMPRRSDYAALSYTALSRGASQSMTFKGLVLSRNLHHLESSQQPARVNQ